MCCQTWRKTDKQQGPEVSETRQGDSNSPFEEGSPAWRHRKFSSEFISQGYWGLSGHAETGPCSRNRSVFQGSHSETLSSSRAVWGSSFMSTLAAGRFCKAWLWSVTSCGPCRNRVWAGQLPPLALLHIHSLAPPP